MSNDPYKVLGLDRNADAKQINDSYKKLALKYHPDKGGDVDMFKEVITAHDMIKTPESRRRYDSLHPVAPDFTVNTTFAYTARRTGGHATTQYAASFRQQFKASATYHHSTTSVHASSSPFSPPRNFATFTKSKRTEEVFDGPRRRHMPQRPGPTRKEHNDQANDDASWTPVTRRGKEKKAQEEAFARAQAAEKAQSNAANTAEWPYNKNARGGNSQAGSTKAFAKAHMNSQSTEEPTRGFSSTETHGNDADHHQAQDFPPTQDTQSATSNARPAQRKPVVQHYEEFLSTDSELSEPSDDGVVEDDEEVFPYLSYSLSNWKVFVKDYLNWTKEAYRKRPEGPIKLNHELHKRAPKFSALRDRTGELRKNLSKLESLYRELLKHSREFSDTDLKRMAYLLKREISVMGYFLQSEKPGPENSEDSQKEGHSLASSSTASVNSKSDETEKTLNGKSASTDDVFSASASTSRKGQSSFLHTLKRSKNNTTEASAGTDSDDPFVDNSMSPSPSSIKFSIPKTKSSSRGNEKESTKKNVAQFFNNDGDGVENSPPPRRSAFDPESYDKQLPPSEREYKPSDIYDTINDEANEDDAVEVESQQGRKGAQHKGKATLFSSRYAVDAEPDDLLSNKSKSKDSNGAAKASVDLKNDVEFVDLTTEEDRTSTKVPETKSKNNNRQLRDMSAPHFDMQDLDEIVKGPIPRKRNHGSSGDDGEADGEEITVSSPKKKHRSTRDSLGLPTPPDLPVPPTPTPLSNGAVEYSTGELMAYSTRLETYLDNWSRYCEEYLTYQGRRCAYDKVNVLTLLSEQDTAEKYRHQLATDRAVANAYNDALVNHANTIALFTQIKVSVEGVHPN